MDDQTPQTPTPLTPEEGELKPVTPDPHAGEPAPEPQEGLRPEADAALVRPEEDEPLGPLTGLVAASAAEAEAELTDDPDAEALLASMGVEDEGIESGQIIGITAAILASVFALVVVLYFLFYVPFRDQTAGLAESDVRYEELEVVRTEGLTKISQYALSADSAYTLPIGSAMAAVAAEYGGGGTPMPRTRAGFNTAVLPTQYAGLDGAYPATTARPDGEPSPGQYTTPELGVVDDVEVETGEEVGVDDPDPDTD